MYVPLISEITMENFLFDYLKEFRGSSNAFIFISNEPIKEEMMMIYKVIPAYEYHFYTISTFSRSNPQVHVLVIRVYLHLSYPSFSHYGKCDSDQMIFIINL